MKVYRFLLFYLLSISLFGIDNIKINRSVSLDLDLLMRCYSINDQRIYWSGLEFTFGSEAEINAVFYKKTGQGKILVESQFFINQPFGKNILKDEERARFHPIFQVETFEMSKLNLQFKIGKLNIKFGKALTPFGRASFPIFNNNLKYGSPFIRSEAILWRETGLFINFKPWIFSIDIAVVNGEENRDTNSGKAGIGRIGIELKKFKLGFSIKEHDGLGSEWQKIYKSHMGFDFWIGFSPFELSGEFIWDEYGFKREFDENEIFWPSSIYYRELFYQYGIPIEGKGGYINLKINLKKVLLNLNYGEYHPQEIGNIYHDNVIKRFILKTCWYPISDFSVFFSVVLENEKEEKGWSQGAKGIAGLFGIQFEL